MAYVLGFFFADGSYDINPRGSEYFSFQVTDKELLYGIRSALHSSHTIAERKPRTDKESFQYRLQIGSKEMCADLRTLGVSRQKAYTMKLPAVPVVYMADFIRGYFDGDGHVWSGVIHKNRRRQHMVLQTGFTSASKDFLVDMHAKLSSLGITGGGVYCKKAAFCIKYSTFDSLELYKIMYSNLKQRSLYLDRKKKVFEHYKKLRR